MTAAPTAEVVTARCAWCRHSLDDSPSLYYCDPTCQALWIARATGARPTPETLRAAIARELSRQAELANAALRSLAPTIASAMAAVSEAFAGLSSVATALGRQLAPLLEQHHAKATAMQRALQARRDRNTGPARTARPPRTINARGTRW